MPRLFKYILLISLILPAHAIAQNNGSTIRLRVICLKKAHPEENLSILGSGNSKIHVVRLTHYNATALKKVQSTGKIRLYAGELTEGEALPPLLIQKQIPANLKNALLVLIPSQLDPIKYSGIWIEDSPNIFKGGYRCFVNLTKVQLGAVVGQEKALIDPGQAHYFKLKKPDNIDDPIRIAVDWRTSPATPWNRLTRKAWTYEVKLRDIVFYYRDPISNRIKHRALSERADILVKKINKFNKKKGDS